MSGNRWSLAFVLMSVVSIAGCGGGGGTNSYTISGTITSAGAGLQGVIVTLQSGGTFTTDATGKFSFPVSTNGTYTITPVRQGYTFSPSTLTASVNGADVTNQDFIVGAITGAVLSCAADHGGGTYGVQFSDYGGIFAADNTAAASAAGTSLLTWQVQFQNPALPAGVATGSLRTRLWAVPYSVSSGVFNSAYLIGEFNPDFTGAGAASPNQLYLGATSTVQVTYSTVQNPPAGEYCIVATLEEYNNNPGICPSPDGFCEDDWWQFGNSWIFY